MSSSQSQQNQVRRKKLGELAKGQAARVISVGDASPESPSETFGNETIDELTQRLMELGLIENSRVEVVHVAPFGGDPIAIRVRGALIALRRAEANRVMVELETGAGAGV